MSFEAKELFSIGGTSKGLPELPTQLDELLTLIYVETSTSHNEKQARHMLADLSKTR